MPLLTLKVYIELIRIDFCLSRKDFAEMYKRVRRTLIGAAPGNPDEIEVICRAVDRASVWYWKQVTCLHRSAATTCLLRRAGIAARLVIAAQSTPFRAHAWVEVEGEVVGDRPYMNEIYTVLDRC